MVFSSSAGDIYYEVHGPENAPVLVFTHGVIMDHRTFIPLIETFSDAYRILLWDMPGHGASCSEAHSFSFAAAAACLIGLLDEIHADTAILIGVSLGGHISQYAAYHYPDRVSAVAVIGSIPLHRRFSRAVKFLLPAAVSASMAMLMMLPEKTFIALNNRGKASSPETLQYLAELSKRAGKKHIAQLHSAMLSEIVTGIEAPVTQPLLIAHGEKEISLNIRLARQWHEAVPGSTYAVISGAGHVANQDNPEECSRLLGAFFNQLQTNRQPSNTVT